MLDTKVASALIGLYPVADTTWSETGVTFSNKPAAGAAAITSKTITGTTAQVYEFDVTSYLKQQKTSGATGVALAGGSDSEQQRPITGRAYQRATAVALHEVGGGRVTETEAGDEESYYQVEVTRDDGSQVDVQLDRNFTVVGSKTDRENSGAGGN